MKVPLASWGLLVLLGLTNGVLGGNLRSETSVATSKISSVSRPKPKSERVFRTRSLYDPNDKLRQFVGSTVLKVPDLQAQQETFVGILKLNVSDFRCFDFAFGDVNLDMLEDGGADQFKLEVTDLLFKCDLGISWAYGWFDGAGNVSVVSDKNYLSAVVSTDTATSEPQGDRNQNCKDTVIDIDTLEFEGDMSMRVMNLYRGFIRRVAEAKVEDIFCQLMSEEMLGLALEETQSTIEDFSRALPAWRSDPLFREGSVIVPGDGSIINLQNDPQMDGLMNLAIGNINGIFSMQIYDPITQTNDCGINHLLRAKLLEDGVFNYYEGAYISEGKSTPLVDINATVTSIKVYGLDSAAVVAPVTVIGSCTIQNRLRWESLTLEVDMTMQVSANSAPGSFFENGAQIEPIVESFKFLQTVTGLDVLASFYVPLERGQVEALPMGYILNWESLPACIPPVLFGMEVSGMQVTVDDIQEPILQGIESQDIDEIAKKSIHIGMASFEDDILQVIPAFIQTEVRDAISEVMVNRRCPVGRRLLEMEDPVDRGLAEEEEFVRPVGEELYFNIICAAVCVCTAALAAGLTMGLLSLDELMLLIKQRAGATEQERKAAGRLLPIVRQHHLLLVSLLLMNAMANEALPLFLDKIVPGYAAVLLSVTLVLFFGEIIPSALFTGPDQVKLASSLAPLVKTVMIILSPIAYPIAKVLDHVLHEESNDGYNRTELSALVRIQYESHLADKRQRKNQISTALKEFESMETIDSYVSRRTSGLSVRPEIRSTLRAMKRQFSHRKLDVSGDLHVDEVTMVEGALQMGTTEAIDVYTPWNTVFAVPSDMVFTERNTVRIYRSGFSRVPVYEKNPEDPEDTTRVVGILVSKQLIVVDSQDQREVSTLPLAVPRCVSPHTTLVDLVNMFQSGGVKGSHMAFVCGRPEEATAALKKSKPIPEDANLLGLVTLEDVLESLIQEEIYDEFDRKERKRLKLARWGVQRWKLFVKKQKKLRGETATIDLIQEPKMMGVVESAMAQHEEERTHPTETTSLLDKLNPFK